MLRTIKQIARSHTTAGFRRSVRNLYTEFQMQRTHFAAVKQARKYPKEAGLKLNLGAGGDPRPGWVNVDLAARAADLRLDLRECLPFDDQTVSTIYSEHFLEHLEYPTDVLSLLRESLRVLAPGGLFSVGVPETQAALVNYVERDDELFERLMATGLYPEWCDTWMHQINHHFRQGNEHKYAYDYETLEKILHGVGFVSIKRREFDASLDSEHRKLGTLYVDAHKPDVGLSAAAAT